MAICYATSKDGITWVKPELGIVQYNDNRANNILWRGSGDSGMYRHGPHGSGIFKDLRDPGVSEERNPSLLRRQRLAAYQLAQRFPLPGHAAAGRFCRL